MRKRDPKFNPPENISGVSTLNKTGNWCETRKEAIPGTREVGLGAVRRRGEQGAELQATPAPPGVPASWESITGKKGEKHLFSF